VNAELETRNVEWIKQFGVMEFGEKCGMKKKFGVGAGLKPARTEFGMKDAEGRGARRAPSAGLG